MNTEEELNRRIYTRCPACGNDTLTVRDRHLLCTWAECPNPTAIHHVKETIEQLAHQLAAVTRERDDAAFALRKMQRMVTAAASANDEATETEVALSASFAEAMALQSLANEEADHAETKQKLFASEAKCEQMRTALSTMQEVFDSDTARRFYTSTHPSGWTMLEVTACLATRNALPLSLSDALRAHDLAVAERAFKQGARMFLTEIRDRGFVLTTDPTEALWLASETRQSHAKEEQP